MTSEFLRCVDPSPLVEQDLLFRVNKQLDLRPSYNKLDSALSKLSTHLSGLSEALSTLNAEFSGMPINRGVVELIKLFSGLFEVIGMTISEQCSMNIRAFTTILLPSIDEHRSAFRKAKSELQRELEEYCQLTDRSKPEIVKQHEDTLESIMCNRAGHFWALSDFSKRTEATVTNGIGLVLTTVMKIFAGEVTDFLEKNKGLFGLVMNQDTKGEMMKAGFHPQSTDITRNEGYLNAKEFWDVRRKRAQPTEKTSVPSGILWIRARRLMTTWTRKFAIFKDGQLTFYDPVTGERQQSISMKLVTTGQVTKKKRRFCFKIQDNDNHIQLEALTQFDMDLWFEVLTKHNMHMLAPAPGEAASELPAVTGKTCADCGCNEATWCSLNWGTMLCLNCSGVHRQMSVNTSKVRSLQLDKLHPYIQDTLSLLTNSTANDLLLARPPDIDVSPRMDESMRRDFITRKYQTREWATRAPPPDPFDAILRGDHAALFFALNFGRSEDRYETMTVLQAAVESGNPTLVAIAACCTNEIDATDGNGWTALTYALVYRHTEIGRFLISMGARADRSKVDMRVLACFVGDEEITKHVMDVVTAPSRPCLVFKPICTTFATGQDVSLTELVIERGRGGKRASIGIA